MPQTFLPFKLEKTSEILTAHAGLVLAGTDSRSRFINSTASLSIIGKKQN